MAPRLAAMAGLALALAGCGSEGANAPGGISEGEAKALEDAASMLDERRLPPDALPPDAQPPEGQAAEMPGDTTASPSK